MALKNGGVNAPLNHRSLLEAKAIEIGCNEITLIVRREGEAYFRCSDFGASSPSMEIRTESFSILRQRIIGLRGPSGILADSPSLRFLPLMMHKEDLPLKVMPLSFRCGSASEITDLSAFPSAFFPP